MSYQMSDNPENSRLVAQKKALLTCFFIFLTALGGTVWFAIFLFTIVTEAKTIEFYGVEPHLFWAKFLAGPVILICALIWKKILS